MNKGLSIVQKLHVRCDSLEVSKYSAFSYINKVLGVYQIAYIVDDIII